MSVIDALQEKQAEIFHILAPSCNFQVSKSNIGQRRYAISYILTLRPGAVVARDYEVEFGLAQQCHTLLPLPICAAATGCPQFSCSTGC